MIGTSGFRKTANFRFEIGNGSRKVYGAEAEGQLYTPSKFHANWFTGLGGVNMGHLKYNGSYIMTGVSMKKSETRSVLYPNTYVRTPLGM